MAFPQKSVSWHKSRPPKNRPSPAVPWDVRLDAPLCGCWDQFWCQGIFTEVSRFGSFLKTAGVSRCPQKKIKRKAKISSLIYSDIICMNLFWWTCWVNEFHVVSPFILIWCDTTLIFWDEWMSGYTRNPGNPKDLVSQESQDSSNFGALNHEFLEVRLIGRFHSMCCKTGPRETFLNFCQTSNLLHSSTAAWSLSKSASVWHRLQRNHTVFPTSFHHLKILEMKNLMSKIHITIRFRFIKPHGIDHQWPPGVFSDLDKADCNSSSAARRSCKTSWSFCAGWTNPFTKYARQIGSFPQGFGGEN